MPSYKVFGECIHSEVPLTESLDSARGEAPLIHFVAPQRWDGPSPMENKFVPGRDGDWKIEWENVGSCHFSAHSRRIETRLCRELPLADIETLFLSDVLPLALASLGILVLHGGAVERDGLAYLILGRSGRGKSNFVANLSRHGFSPMADDAVRMKFESGRWMAVGGLSDIRLYPEDLLVHGQRALDETAFAKGRMRLGGAVGRPVPVAHIFELIPTDGEVEFHSLTGSVAFRCVARNAFSHTGVMRQSEVNIYDSLFSLAESVPCTEVLWPHRRSREPIQKWIQFVNHGGENGFDLENSWW